MDGLSNKCGMQQCAQMREYNRIIPACLLLTVGRRLTLFLEDTKSPTPTLLRSAECEAVVATVTRPSFDVELESNAIAVGQAVDSQSQSNHSCKSRLRYKNECDENTLAAHLMKKKRPEETQALLAGCSMTELKKSVAPSQTPSPGARDGQNLISWRWSLPLPTDPSVW